MTYYAFPGITTEADPIVLAVLQYYQIGTLNNKSRKTTYRKARQIICFANHLKYIQENRMLNEDIKGKSFNLKKSVKLTGYKSHANVIHAIRKISYEYRIYPGIRKEINDILKTLQIKIPTV